MNPRPARFSFPLMVAIGLMTSTTVEAAPQAGVPALLQFAEQYQKQTSDAVPPTARPTTNTEKAPANKAVSELGNRSTRKNSTAATLWQTKDAKIQRLQETIVQLERQVRTMEKQRTETIVAPQSPPDVQTLRKLAQGMRQVLSLTPEEAQIKEHLQQVQQQMSLAQVAEKTLGDENNALKEQLAAMQTQNAKLVTEARNTLTTQLQLADQDKATLQTHLSEAKKVNQTLTADNDSVKAQLARLKATEAEHRGTKTQTQEKLNELQVQRNALQAELDGQVSEVANLKTELGILQKEIPAKIQSDAMKQPVVRQAYAAGISLGEEMLQMHNERQKWGVNIDKQVLLAGLLDAFSGKRQLNDEALNSALAASEREVAKARDKVLSTQLQQGNTYLANFKKDKRVKNTPTGAWYRIDYTGDSSIPTDATLDVIIKETLTNGTVIQDMDTSGAVLSQPLSEFPPLFADALRLLKNHGSLTLVVPPELAYGEKGYPPNVPPNATMVYHLRIDEVYPKTPKKKESPTSTASSQ